MVLTAGDVGPFLRPRAERIVAERASCPFATGRKRLPVIRDQPREVPMRVLHTPRSPEKAPASDGPISRTAKSTSRFGFHFLEMCAVMCLGGGVLIAVFFGVAALLGFTDLTQEAPALSALICSVILAGAMVAWMRFRRMEWRPTLEMAGSSVAAGVLLIVGYWIGVVSQEALVPSVCGLACVAMLAVMLFRLPLYSSGHAGHHAGAN